MKWIIWLNVIGVVCSHVTCWDELTCMLYPSCSRAFINHTPCDWNTWKTDQHTCTVNPAWSTLSKWTKVSLFLHRTTDVFIFKPFFVFHCFPPACCIWSCFIEAFKQLRERWENRWIDSSHYITCFVSVMCQVKITAHGLQIWFSFFLLFLIQ